MNLSAEIFLHRVWLGCRNLLSSTFRRGFAAWALTVLLLPGCYYSQWSNSITGSGRTVNKTLELAGFSKVRAGSAFQVTITRGDKHSVVVTVDDNILEHLDVTQSGKTLHLGLKPNLSIRNATLKVDVVMPDLTSLALGGASRMTVTGFTSDKPLDAELGGASSLGGDIKSGDARFHASGASKIQLQGSAQNLRVKAAGASNVSLDRFASNDTVVEASGASHVSVNASGKLDAQASGASSVRYVGTPASVSSHAAGASSIKQK